jgi:hypothetical protein
MKYQLKIYGFHDYDDVYTRGEYDTYEEAEKAAQGIVKSELRSCYKKGEDAAYMLGRYTHFCDDPTVVPSKDDGTYFSASTYAKTVADEVWKRCERFRDRTGFIGVTTGE